MTVSELYFSATGREFYARGIAVTLIGVGFLACGLAGVVFIPWTWSNALPLAGGAFCVVLGGAFLLFAWLAVVYGTITVWRRWRQFRQPAAIINGSGVRYLAIRRPVQIPWPDIEEINWDRTILSRSVVTKVDLRLVPDAAVLHDGPVKVPATRYLNVGMMSDLDVPEDTAVRFLAETAGPRLQITETDRRTPAEDADRP